MRFFAALLGNSTRSSLNASYLVLFQKILINFLLFLSISTAHASDYEYMPAFDPTVNWTKVSTYAGLGALAILGITQFEESDIIFGGLYGFGAIYYIHEEIDTDEGFQYEEYVVPIGLATLALVNLTLLDQEDESKSTVFFYNALGAGLIAYAWTQFDDRGQRFFVAPVIQEDRQFIQVSFNY